MIKIGLHLPKLS